MPSSSDLSGVLLVPPQPRRERSFAEPRARRPRRVALVIGLAAIAGAATAAGVWWRDRDPSPPPAPAPAAIIAPSADEDPARLAALESELAAARAALASAERARAESAAALAAQSAAATALQDRLAGAVQGDGSVTQDGDSIHLELVDKVLFRVGDDTLTDRGRAVLARVGAALADLPDKQIWVQGHTDTTPIRGPRARFASNWELSAARALTVVHYLQSSASVDPRRLAAVAFGEHRPASRSKARNRRIEIVLYPRHQLARE